MVRSRRATWLLSPSLSPSICSFVLLHAKPYSSSHPSKKHMSCSAPKLLVILFAVDCDVPVWQDSCSTDCLEYLSAACCEAMIWTVHIPWLRVLRLHNTATVHVVLVSNMLLKHLFSKASAALTHQERGKKRKKMGYVVTHHGPSLCIQRQVVYTATARVGYASKSWQATAMTGADEGTT